MVHAVYHALILVLVLFGSPLRDSVTTVGLTASGQCALRPLFSGRLADLSSDHPTLQGDTYQFSSGQSNFVDDADDQEVTTIPLRAALSGIADYWLVAAGSILTRPSLTAETLWFGAIFRTLCRFRC